MKFEGLKSIISFISLYFVFSPYLNMSPFLAYFGMQMQINPISKLNIVRSCLIIHREHKSFEKICIVSGKMVKNEQEMNNIMIFMKFFGRRCLNF